jgi:hypothetical protein
LADLAQRFCVSMCTGVPVKQVNGVPVLVRRFAHARVTLRVANYVS